MLHHSFDPRLPHRFVRYGRMSSDQQNARSPEQQFDTIAQLVGRHGHPWFHVRDYRDDGISGRYLKKRAGFQQMLRDIESGATAVDLILVDTAERFGRVDELTAIRQKLYNRHGVLVLTADSHFSDPTSAAGKALTMVETMRATEDGRIKAHNVLRGKRDAARARHWPGGPPPFGYRLQSVLVERHGRQEVDHCILVPEPATAWIIRKLFQQAHDTGWGCPRLSRSLNADPDIPDQHKPFYPDTIGYWLSNPIYHGELLWEEHATGIVDDTRVIRRNAEEDMVRVPDFCEPLVTREVWESVAELRKARSEDHARRRRAASHGPAKQIAPVAPGVVLKYLLSGLVRCGECGLSMRALPSGQTSKAGKKYVYYICPGAVAGACQNKIHLREDLLRHVVMARLRDRLFPSPGQIPCPIEPGHTGPGIGPAMRSMPDPGRRLGMMDESERSWPNWLGPLCEEIANELDRLDRSQDVRRPDLEREAADLQARLDGWAISLAKPDLSPGVREDIEEQYDRAKARLQTLRSDLSGLEARQARHQGLVDPRQVLDRLQRLGDVLASGNVAQGNLELCRHIDRIDAYADGRVVMRTSKLGIFDGAATVLARPAASTPSTAVDAGAKRIRPRHRGHVRLDQPLASGSSLLPETGTTADPGRFADLDPKWFWEDELEIGGPTCWSAEHAAEVAGLRGEGWTMARLAAHFGRSEPTIRHALKIAAERGLITPTAARGRTRPGAEPPG